MGHRVRAVNFSIEVNLKSFIVRAPTRVDLAGGTLDLWPIPCLIPGASTINLAISSVASVQFSMEQDTRFSVTLDVPRGSSQGGPPSVTFRESLPRNMVDSYPSNVRFPAFLVSEFLRHQRTLPPFAISMSWSAQAPMGSGLGGSSTLAVAIARGFAHILGTFSEAGWQWRLLAWVRDVEASFLGVPTGTQDYLAALFGGLNRFEFRMGEIVRTPYRLALMREIEKRCVILFSGEQHQSGLSNWEVFRSALEGKGNVREGLTEIAQITKRMDSVLKREEPDWKQLGALVSEEWRVRAEVFGVSTPRLDKILTFLSTKSVLGAKVCGAAQGGSLLVLTSPDKRESLSQECQRYGIRVLESVPQVAGVEVQLIDEPKSLSA